MATSYDEAQYAADFYALDADVYAACLSLAPEYEGASVTLSDLDELCRRLQRPVRDDRERTDLMTRLDPVNIMRIDRLAFTTWLLEEFYAARDQPINESTTSLSSYTVTVPTWEEIVEPSTKNGGVPSVYYYNSLTSETAWAITRPFAACLYKYLAETTEIRVLKASRDPDGFVDVASVEMVDDLRTLFVTCDDDRNGRLDANEFRDLCVAIAFPLGLDSDSILWETMREIDLQVDGSSFSGVSWEALAQFWTTYVPWQRRTRLVSPYDQWERLERLDQQNQTPVFRHVTTLRERWQPPNTEQSIVELLTKLFPSTKLEWRERIEMLWDLELQSRSADPESAQGTTVVDWTLRECRALFEQLGWDHCTRREHVVSAIQNLQRQYGGDPEKSETLQKETLVAWMLDCVARVERDGWDECIDESTGQVYYYHEVRGVAQWDPPHLEDRMAQFMARFSGGGSTDDPIQRIFRHYDEDESGSISFHEFKRLYIALLGRKEAITGDSEADDAQIRQVFSVLDTSGDDEVSLDEFMVWWKTKMHIVDEETEQQRRARIATERKRIAIDFLTSHDALIVTPTEEGRSTDHEEPSQVVHSFESNILARLVGVLGKYPLKGLAFRDALMQLVRPTKLVDQEIVLDEFLEWYVTFEEREREKEELVAQKARALAMLQAREAEAKAKAHKLKMIRKGQLITKAIPSDAAVGGAPEPAELVWKRHIQTLFRKFDKDNSGYLDATELQELTQALGHVLDAAQIKQMIAVMDTSGDERVSVDEFVTFWTAFQRRKRAVVSASPTKAPVHELDEAHRREAISMVDASTTLAVNMELAKERALKVSIADVKDALGDWKEALVDRSRKKKEALEHAELERQRFEALKKEWASFVPTKKRRYAQLDVTWIEPDVVRCMVEMIETIRKRARPLPRQDAAQRIQRIVRGVVTRMQLFAMVLKRFSVYVDVDTGFFYYVDTEEYGRVWLHRPLFRTITSPMAPWDLIDCKTKVEKLRFRHRQRTMQAKTRYYHQFLWTSDGDSAQWMPPNRLLFVPASFVMYNVIEEVRLRVLGNFWHALRDRSFVLAELMAQRHWRQLTQRSNRDASAPLPLHYVVHHHRNVPFRLIQAIYQGYPDAVRVKDVYGRTPLHLALRERAGRDVVELLLSRRRCLVDEPTRATPKRTSVWDMQSVSGETPLHIALRYEISLELLRWLCRHPSLHEIPHETVTTIQNTHGHAIFHLVISTLFDATNAAYWRSVVLILLRMWPRRALCSDVNGTGDLPLHLAIQRYADVLHKRQLVKESVVVDDEGSWVWLIRLLITEFPEALLTRRKHDSLLPIHLLMRVGLIPESLVRETLDATVAQVHATRDKSTTTEPDLLTPLTLIATKTTLLHYALLHRPEAESLLLQLLELLPTACQVLMKPQDELPLHLAARHGASVSIINRLCELYGAACQVRNGQKALPLHIAVQNPAMTEDTIRVLLHYCPFMLSESQERHGLRSLVLAANAKMPHVGVLRALLDQSPSQKITSKDHKHHVTPLYALSLRKCPTNVATSGMLDELESKFEQLEDDDTYFLAIAKAKHRQQHHCPTASWSFVKILKLMEHNPVDEAIIQRSLLALNNKLITLMEVEASSRTMGTQENGGLGVVVETVTLNRDWMIVRRIHQTLYELPWNARIQVLGQKVLTKLLPTAFAKAAYKARIDPYFNL